MVDTPSWDCSDYNECDSPTKQTHQPSLQQSAEQDKEGYKKTFSNNTKNLGTLIKKTF